jgi:hypothetical protein
MFYYELDAVPGVKQLALAGRVEPQQGADAHPAGAAFRLELGRIDPTQAHHSRARPLPRPRLLRRLPLVGQLPPPKRGARQAAEGWVPR